MAKRWARWMYGGRENERRCSYIKFSHVLSCWHSCADVDDRRVVEKIAPFCFLRKQALMFARSACLPTICILSVKRRVGIATEDVLDLVLVGSCWLDVETRLQLTSYWVPAPSEDLLKSMALLCSFDASKLEFLTGSRRQPNPQPAVWL